MTVEWTRLPAGERVAIYCDRCGRCRFMNVDQYHLDLLGREQIAEAHASNHNYEFDDEDGGALCDDCTEGDAAGHVTLSASDRPRKRANRTP